jgi:hypothetical protein
MKIVKHLNINLLIDKVMVMNTQIDEKQIFEKDVKSMSYEDLMAAIRFLDDEREVLSKQVHEEAAEQNNKFLREEKIKRVA